MLIGLSSCSTSKKPNFIIIFTDDQGYQDLGSFGSPNIKTPNIDKMALEGMKFTSFYAQTVCGPSREEVDFNVGRIMDALKENGLDNNTYVIFTSDNGPWWIKGEHGGNAEPLRGAKTSSWEGGLRVPYIVRAPGKVPVGNSSDLVTATIDLLPTIAKIAGVDLPTDRVIDGLDISDILHGKSAELERPFFYYKHKELRAVRFGDWKLHLANLDTGRTSYGKRWMPYHAPEDRVVFNNHALFNLTKDIGETMDVANKYPTKVAELLKLAEWARNDIGDFDRRGKNARAHGNEPYLTPNDFIPIK